MTSKEESDQLRNAVICKCGSRMKWHLNWKVYTCIVCGRCFSKRIAERREVEEELKNLPGPYPLITWSTPR